MLNTNDCHITIIPNHHRVRVIHYGITVADTNHALTLQETGCPDTIYFPPQDVNMARLKRSDQIADCPHKGRASYFHLQTEENGVLENAAWSYESPLVAVRQIKGYIAFYSSRVDRIDQTS